MISIQELRNRGWGDLDLRSYQLHGVNWLIGCYNNKHGCILGDEMGLGKTCQTIAVLAYLRKTPTVSPHLVVCPRAVLENWQVECKRFAPQLKVTALIGTKEYRKELCEDLKKKSKSGEYPFDVLLTTYEICLKDHSFLQSIPWHILVVDEAHRLKNHQSLLYTTLEQWDVYQTILLTGTPVQNNLSELYALLSFCDRKQFQPSKLDQFVEKYSKQENKEIEELHALLKPYLLRRTKSGELKDLPNKSEVILYHGLSPLQKKLYKAILIKDLDVFDNSNPNVKSTSLMNILMQLRKCVNHPYLFDGVEPEPFELGDHLIEASGKLVLIDQLLGHMKRNGHKVLMFSQMTHMLDILQDYLGYKGYTYERLDGSVRGEERFLSIQKFNQNEETFVFLLSTKAGGQGINLTSADTVIFVDSDFNPQNDLQAAARAHRIGQKRAVKIIRLIGRHSVEEIILKRAEDKLKLTEKVIESGQFALGKQPLFASNKSELQDVLRFGAEKLLSDEEDKEDDFRKILGPTLEGEWTLDENKDVESLDVDEEVEEGPQSMYMFEGTDYSNEPTAEDRKAFDALIEAERKILESHVTGERAMRKKTSVLIGALPEIIRKPRKQLTPEQLEERKRKRKEAAEKRAKLAEEKEIRRAQEQRKMKFDMWKSMKYSTCNIAIDSEDDDNDDDDDEDDISDDETTQRSIKYVSGDVTHPIDTDNKHNIIVHCADDSGRWGRGGLFSAIASRSPQPEKQYELAGKCQDLALGDCHLINIDDIEGREDGEDLLGLIIAQHRDKRNNLSGIKLSALRLGLEKIYVVAKAKKASVHLPRIGHDTPGFNWYGTERLINKILTSRGIPTYIYYFPRKHSVKRKSSSISESNASKVQKKSLNDRLSSSPEPSTSSSHQNSTNHDEDNQKKSANEELSSIFEDQLIVLHGLPEDKEKHYKRYIVAYDGDIGSKVTDYTTHVVVQDSASTEEISSVRKQNSSVAIVTTQWLDDCLSKRRYLHTKSYLVTEH
ncbi:hypothetical protein SNE40_012242 [Patella caerulea]|uniref:Chromodomain-helicase-DNA-binding protein 1-like n=1 Tax=Patella caerulea TaxID=87958 RepID=A0AAN8JS11_PATCE